jgi:hypothetical protein
MWTPTRVGVRGLADTSINYRRDVEQNGPSACLAHLLAWLIGRRF